MTSASMLVSLGVIGWARGCSDAFATSFCEMFKLTDNGKRMLLLTLITFASLC